LVDGDLLAPVLLNVRQLSFTTYEELQEARPRLQSLLDRIPERQSLADAGRDDFELIGELFGVVDDRAIRGARGTVISKVLHRKRPDFIPLYDLRVGAVYQHGPDAPVPVVKHRPWREFAPLFAAAIKADLRREAEFWGQVSALASEPAITPLRALDIVAWSVSPVARGKRTSRKGMAGLGTDAPIPPPTPQPDHSTGRAKRPSAVINHSKTELSALPVMIGR